jgi:hypothetical protein
LSGPADGVLEDAFAAMIFVSLWYEDLLLGGSQKVKLYRLPSGELETLEMG